MKVTDMVQIERLKLQVMKKAENILTNAKNINTVGKWLKCWKITRQCFTGNQNDDKFEYQYEVWHRICWS